jgi:hypothetical protein
MKVTRRDSIYKLCLVQSLHTNEYHKVIIIINSTYHICHHTHTLSILQMLCCLIYCCIWTSLFCVLKAIMVILKSFWVVSGDQTRGNCDVCDISTVEIHSSRLIGRASHPDIQKIQIIGFFFENMLHWQFEVWLLLFTPCIYV